MLEATTASAAAHQQGVRPTQLSSHVISLHPIAYVRSPRKVPLDDNWGDVVSEIELCDDVPSDALLGLDAIDGSPVLDVKPVVSEFLPKGDMRQPLWSRELMKNYWRKEGESEDGPNP